MPQIFHRSTNTISRVSIVGALVLVTVFLWGALEAQRSPYFSWREAAGEQPVQFSHKHHVSGLGIDCRYCHTSVETSSFAGLPATSICMNCHAYIWNQSPMLEPVRASFATDQPIVWTRVHDVADFAYFNHSI